MNVVSDQVKELVQREYRQAKKDHKPIASLHEGYAVLLEEVQETKEACEQIEEYCNLLWENIRRDNPELAEYNINTIIDIAIETACEAIQVAAVCRRILDRCKEGENG